MLTEIRENYLSQHWLVGQIDIDNRVLPITSSIDSIDFRSYTFGSEFTSHQPKTIAVDYANIVSTTTSVGNITIRQDVLLDVDKNFSVDVKSIIRSWFRANTKWSTFTDFQIDILVSSLLLKLPPQIAFTTSDGTAVALRTQGINDFNIANTDAELLFSGQAAVDSSTSSITITITF